MVKKSSKRRAGDEADEVIADEHVVEVATQQDVVEEKKSKKRKIRIKTDEVSTADEDATAATSYVDVDTGLTKGDLVDALRLADEDEEDAASIKKKKKKKTKLSEEEDRRSPERNHSAETTGAKIKKHKAEKSRTGDEEIKKIDDAEEADSTEHHKKVPETVFISGLPFDWSVTEIESLLKDQGFAHYIGPVRAPTWQDSGRLRGYCHVDFGTAAEAEKCVTKLHQHTPKGTKRWLDVKLANTKKDAGQGHQRSKLPKGVKRIFVKNLPYTATEDEVAKLFRAHGAVDSIRMGHENGRMKGFCYVEFADRKEAIKALQQESAYTLGGRHLVVDADTGSGPKAGYHYRDTAWETGFAKKDKKKQAW